MGCHGGVRPSNRRAIIPIVMDLKRLHELNAAVAASPYDMTPRYAYAGAIAARDPARAAFIYQQLGTGKDPRCGGHRGGDSGDARMIERQHGPRWAGEVGRLVDCYGFERGFIEIVTLSGERLVAGAEKLGRLAPVTALTLTRPLKPHLAEVLAVPWLKNLVTLDLSDTGLTQADIEAIAATHALHQLRTLVLNGNDLNVAAMCALGALPGLTRVFTERTDVMLFVQRFYNDPRTWDTIGPLPEYTSELLRGQDRSGTNEDIVHVIGDRPWLEPSDG